MQNPTRLHLTLRARSMKKASSGRADKSIYWIGSWSEHSRAELVTSEKELNGNPYFVQQQQSSSLPSSTSIPSALRRSLNLLISSFSSRMSLPLASSFTTALQTICFARSAYLHASEKENSNCEIFPEIMSALSFCSHPISLARFPPPSSICHFFISENEAMAKRSRMVKNGWAQRDSTAETRNKQHYQFPS